ncbi:nitronate monooxygenase, partial [Pseudomonas syringae pv. tagetis]
MSETGPVSALAPAFPLAGGALMALLALAEKGCSSDFTNLWAGQAVVIKHQLGAT